MSEGTRYLRVGDVARELGLGRARIYRMVREGLLPAVRDRDRRRTIRFPREAFERWMAQRVEDALKAVHEEVTSLEVTTVNAVDPQTPLV